MSNGTSTKDGMMSMPEFASALRTRFPMYSKESDLDLVNAFLKMYPQYRGTVNLAETPGSPKPAITPQPMAEPSPRAMTAYQTAIRPLEVGEQNVRGLAAPAITALSIPLKAQAAAVQGPGALKDFLNQQGGEALQALNPASALQAINPANLVDVRGFRELGIPQGIAGTATNLATAGALGKLFRGSPSPYKLSPKARTNKLAYGIGAAGSDVDYPAALRGSQPHLDVGMQGQPRTTRGVVEGAVTGLNNIGNEFNLALQRVAGQRIVPQAIQNYIRARMNVRLLNTPEGRAEYQDLQNAMTQWQRPWSLADLDYERGRANARLAPFRRMSAADKANFIKTHGYRPQVDEAIVEGTKDEVYPRLDRAAGKPAGYFERLKQAQSHLINIRDQAIDHATELSNVTAELAGAPRWTPESLELRAHTSGHFGPGGVIGTLRKGIFGPPDYETRATKAVKQAYKPRTLRQKALPYAAGAAVTSAARRNQDEEEEPPQ